MKIQKAHMAALALTACLSGAAQAALNDRGGGLIYDDVLNVTWLQDGNYAQTSGYSATGMFTWGGATFWAANLSYFDSVRNITLTGWRLPTSDTSCAGYDCIGSEMGHLFSDLGGVAGQSIATTHNANYSLFTNVQPYLYWSGTELATNTIAAWYYSFSNGYQFDRYKDLYAEDSSYAWAVRNGDVAAVPEPDTYAMLLAGLGSVCAAARRDRANLR